MDSNHQVGAHLSRNIDRKVVEESAVDINAFALTHWTEDCWDGHRCAKRLGQRAVLKDMLATRDHIDRDATEGNRQFIEVFEVGVGQQLTVKDQSNPIPSVEAGREANTILQAKLEGVGIISAIFFAAEGDVLIAKLVSQDFVPICAADEFP